MNVDTLVDGLLETQGLKDLLRAGWVRVGVPSPEDVAAHSWGVALLVVALLPAGMDRGLALSYAVLHDLPEVRAGDITPADGVSTQHKAHREHAAMAALGASLPPHLQALWLDYEAQQTAEARFVRQLDRVDMALRALRLHAGGQAGMKEFVESARTFVTHEELTPIMAAVVKRLQ